MAYPYYRLGALAAAVAVVGVVAVNVITSTALAAVTLFFAAFLAFWVGTPRDVASARQKQGAHLPRSMPVGFGQALLNALPVPLIVMNFRGRITYFNTAMPTLGTRLELGDHFALVFRAPAFVNCVNSVISGQGAQTCEFKLPDKQKIFRASVSVLPRNEGLGADQQVIAVIEDRTEDARSDAMRRDFIANASHELRTPLASMLGYIETLQGHARNDPEARQRFLGIMDAQARRMARLVDDLMSLSRIELENDQHPTDRCQIFSVVREAVTALSPLAEKNGVRLTVSLPDEDPHVFGDRDQLIQAVTNLVDNALKYGGGNPVSIVGRSDPEKVWIDVIDQGRGIERDHLLRLTERFYRVNVSESRNIGGTGLGLAIVKHILMRHRGGLETESEHGSGSRFSIWIPRADHMSDPASP